MSLFLCSIVGLAIFFLIRPSNPLNGSRESSKTQSNDVTEKGPKKNKNSIINLANQKATQEGFDLTKYDTPHAEYDSTAKEQEWTVFYEGKIKKPGNHFLVWVNDDNGNCELMRGE